MSGISWPCTDHEHLRTERSPAARLCEVSPLLTVLGAEPRQIERRSAAVSFERARLWCGERRGEPTRETRRETRRETLRDPNSQAQSWATGPPARSASDRLLYDSLRREVGSLAEPTSTVVCCLLPDCQMSMIKVGRMKSRRRKKVSACQVLHAGSSCSNPCRTGSESSSLDPTCPARRCCHVSPS